MPHALLITPYVINSIWAIKFPIKYVQVKLLAFFVLLMAKIIEANEITFTVKDIVARISYFPIPIYI